LTTIEMARVIEMLVRDHRELHGLWHVSGQPISKYQLLVDFAALLNRRTRVVPDDTVVIDRSLSSERFRAAAQYLPPSWEQMLAELASAVRAREDSRSAA
jgi:dTDP-4-dehydrorhamnose reductase